MGGGITAALALVVVLDGMLSSIHSIGQWTFGEVTSDLQNGISGDSDTTHGVLAAALGTIASSGFRAVVVAPAVGVIAACGGEPAASADGGVHAARLASSCRPRR